MNDCRHHFPAWPECRRRIGDPISSPFIGTQQASFFANSTHAQGTVSLAVAYAVFFNYSVQCYYRLKWAGAHEWLLPYFLSTRPNVWGRNGNAIQSPSIGTLHVGFLANITHPHVTLFARQPLKITTCSATKEREHVMDCSCSFPFLGMNVRGRIGDDISLPFIRTLKAAFLTNITHVNGTASLVFA